MEATYTGREEIRRGGREYSAEITIRASVGEPPSAVTISAEALDDLGSAFKADFDFQRGFISAPILTQIDCINVEGDCPYAGAASFHVEVTGIRVSGNPDRRIQEFVLMFAGMHAIEEYLCDWEDTQAAMVRDGSPTPNPDENQMGR